MKLEGLPHSMGRPSFLFAKAFVLRFEGLRIFFVAGGPWGEDGAEEQKACGLSEAAYGGAGDGTGTWRKDDGGGTGTGFYRGMRRTERACRRRGVEAEEGRLRIVSGQRLRFSAGDG